jgi:SUMO ligase MMS21 Smc5/6 complex component
MALPLTVQTETVLVNPIRCPRGMSTTPEIETGDLETEVGPRILIDNTEARRELERRNTPTDLEETREDLKSITKMLHKTTSVAPVLPTKTWIEFQHLLRIFDTMIAIDMLRREHEPGAGHRTDQIVEWIVMDVVDSQEEMTGMEVVEMMTADSILMEMGTTVGRHRTCQ